MKKYLLLLIILLNVQIGHACRCALKSLALEFELATDIFKGVAMHREKAEEGYEYTFKVNQVWKGKSVDIITINTGFGGGDCGSKFELSEEYVVFAIQGRTSICRKNAKANETNYDLILDYYYNQEFRKNAFISDESTLNSYESAYLNEHFSDHSSKYDFSDKTLAFAQDESFINISDRFKNNWEHQNPISELLILTEEVKTLTGFDAIIVTWRKNSATLEYPKELIKKLKRRVK